MPSEMAKKGWIEAGRKLLTTPSLIFAVALATRVWVLWQLLPAHAWINFYPWNEPSRIAWAMNSGYGYSSPWRGTPLAPTAQQPPVFPLIMAGIFKIGGAYTMQSLWMATLLNATFSACSAVVIFYLGKRDFGEVPAIIAAWTWAAWSYEAVIPIRLWESSLTALLLGLTLWWLPRVAESRRWRAWCGLGLLGGFAAQTNTTTLAVFPCFYAWLWMGGKIRGLSPRKFVAASVAVFVLTLVPWTVRNYVTFHRVMPLRDNFGMELWIGNYDGVTAEQKYPREFPLLDPTEYNRLGEMPFMQEKLHEGLSFIVEHPGEFVRLSLVRFVFFWTQPKGSWWFVPSVLAWIGMVLLLRGDVYEALPYAIVMVVFPLVYYVTHTFPSYRHPMEPVVLLLAAHSLYRLASFCFPLSTA
jgi:hypothetical protein